MNKKFVVFTAFMLFLSAHFLIATTYYVDRTNGHDSNDGLTPSTAWKTIAKANNELMPGDVVYVLAGTYSEIIKPRRSGEQGNRITYARYQTHEVIITDVDRAIDLRDRHFIKIDGFKILYPRSNAGWANLGYPDGASTYNIIQNCYMEGCDEYNGIHINGGDSHHNGILYNTLKGVCGPNTPRYGGPSDLIALKNGAHHNLIEGNIMIDAPHAVIDSQDESPYNIIRNNTIINKFHTGINLFTNSHFNLVEGNYILDSGDICGTYRCPENECGSGSDQDMGRRYHSGILVGSSHNIFRNNFFRNNGSGIYISSRDNRESLGNHIYNNFFYKNYMGLYINSTYPVKWTITKNNLFFDNIEYELSIFINEGLFTNYFISNFILGSFIKYCFEGVRPIGWLQENYPTQWRENITTDPKLIGKNLRTLIKLAHTYLGDRGNWLTSTIGSGSGTNIPVRDAWYFMDGLELIEGDLIQLEGQTETVHVIHVDYVNSILVVDSPLSWEADQGVSLSYDDQAPSIGPLEYLRDQ